MKRLIAPSLAVACLLAPAVPSPAQVGGNVLAPYRAAEAPPVHLADSPRLDSLLRGGVLYLTLQDAIALAIENNLDVELGRYASRIAESDLTRARAGGPLRAQDVAPGAAVTSLEPVLVGQLDWAHRSQPLTNAFSTGTNALVSDSRLYNLGIQKGFLTGTTVNLGWNNNWLSQNSGRADFNPATAASLGLTVRQKLLQGFGRAVNSRFIRIAKNNIDVSDLAFRQQVIATVSAAAATYWDLARLSEDVRVRKQTLGLAEKLLEDNRQRVELGSLAAIEVVRSRAEVARARQDLTIAETALRQQESLLKDLLARTTVTSGALSGARIITIDRLREPDLSHIRPVRDLVRSARSSRPELAQAGLEIENAKLSLKGTKSALLPSLDLVASFQNNALAGDINALPIPPVQGSTALPRLRDESLINPFFIGGYGTVASQLFARNFPDYSIGVQLTIPLRNRAAQADVVRDQLALRQQEIRRRQVEKQVEVDVERALIAAEQARSRFQAAAEFRVYEEQTLEAEQYRYELGASTTFFIIQAQRDLAQARSAEIGAMSDYTKAAIELDRATGRTLEANNVVIEEARRGVVSRAPDPAPVLGPQ